MLDHPYMDEGLRRWIASYARRNHWRIANWSGNDNEEKVQDLIQEGYAVYLKVLRHPNYVGLAKRRNPTKENRRVFMSLVKRAFENRVHDLSNEKPPEDTLSTVAVRMGRIDEAVLDTITPPDEDEDPRDKLPLEHFSEALTDLRTAMSTDLGDAFGYIKTKGKRTGLTKRETDNQRWCRLATLIARRTAKELGFKNYPTYDPKVVDMLDLAMQYDEAGVPG